MTETILILGGTKEASDLAASLVRSQPNFRIITSLAGRTKEPAPVAGEVRIGGFGGALGLATYIKENAVTRVIDATHPFAKQISANAQAAANMTEVPLEIRTRKPWQKLPDDQWIEVADGAAAITAIPSGSHVLLALGSQHIAPFAIRNDVHFVVRMVDQPDQAIPLPNHSLLIGKPSADWRDERRLLLAHSISHIVCRNSGGNGAYAKIEAARNLALPVIIIGR